ncbi:MAG: hypothetical protein EBS86_11785, partial [Crocinitomicaceae bacterium]|nr:hypothetical protein [Crocinitomicaceae bacterium]
VLRIYFNGSRSFLPIEAGDNFVRISLIKKNLSGQFQSTTGGTILSNGVKVVFPANAITRNGIDYNGIVKVYVCNINPDDENIADLMPGSLFGEMNNEAKLLVSFGMVNVELKDSENNNLQIKSGQKATVHFPLPNSILADSPETIDLWHFDETQGFWKNEGTATKTGNEYIAEVGHFSWWNFDQPENFSRIELSVKDYNNKHMSNIKVVFETSSFGNGIQYTNNEGNISAMIRKDQNVTAKAFMLCNGNYTLIHTQVLGSTFTETNHSIIIPQIPSIIKVSGQVLTCNDLPLNYGYVIANNQIYFCDDGKYTFLTCENTLKIYGVDLLNHRTSNIITREISGQEVILNDLKPCNDVVLSSVTDDGYNYKTIQIGDQVWMAENLRTTKYSNGDSIPKVLNSQTWGSLTSGAYTTYNNGDEKGKIYAIKSALLT